VQKVSPALGGLALLLVLPLLASGNEQWKIQFFYDKADSSLDIRDFQCPTAAHCIAAGAIDDKNGHSKGTVVSTIDGGKNWALSEVKEQPVSLFFLSETQGWMATEKGVWSTIDGGKSWKKLDGLKKGILQVYFVNPSHGYAIGFPKAVYETTNAGKSWTKLAIADRPPTVVQDTTYECISFNGPHGIIVGNAPPPDSDETPLWLNPAEARGHKERRSTLVVLETTDGGVNWDFYTASFYGKMTQLAMSKEDSGLAVVEYHNYYNLASRVYNVKFKSSMASVFGEKDRAVTDAEWLPDGGGLIAAIEPPGATNQVPIPGKLKMLKSKDLKVWEEMAVDYRAVAQRATLAAPDADHLFVATDTGMILKLEP
jgi:hypothetical protein